MNPKKAQKVVGKRRPNPRPDPQELDGFFNLLETMRPTQHVVPKGIYRFRTFEDAQQWMKSQMARTVRRSTRGRQRPAT